MKKLFVLLKIDIEFFCYDFENHDEKIKTKFLFAGLREGDDYPVVNEIGLPGIFNREYFSQDSEPDYVDIDAVDAFEEFLKKINVEVKGQDLLTSIKECFRLC